MTDVIAENGDVLHSALWTGDGFVPTRVPEKNGVISFVFGGDFTDETNNSTVIQYTSE